MKKTIAAVLSLVLVMALAGITFAADKKEAAPAPAAKQAAPAAKEAVGHAAGEVAAVDVNAGTLTVKEKKGDLVVSVDANTSIMAGKDKKTLADIKAGEKVAVVYAAANGKNTAKSIEIRMLKAASAKRK